MKEKIETMYLDYFNNFLTVDRFAEYYNISLPVAHIVLKIGQRLNDRRSKTCTN